MFIPVKELLKSKRVQGLLVFGVATLAQNVLKLPIQEADIQAIVKNGCDAAQAIGFIWLTIGAAVAQKPLIKK